MERQYIFFATGVGLGVLGLGLVALFTATALLALFAPLGRATASLVVVLGAVLVVWLSFFADAWRLRRGKKNGTNTN